MSGFEAQFGRWVIRFRWPIIIITLLLVGLAASGARFLVFKNDARIYFSKENPQLQALEALENTFSRDDNVLYIVAPKNGDVFSGDTLEAIAALTEEAWKTPYSTRVDSITNFQNARAEGDELIVADLVGNPDQLSKTDLARIRATALGEPLLVNRLISPSGHVSAISVLVTKPGKDLNETSEITGFSRELAAKIKQQYPQVEIYLTGGILIDNAFGEASRDDMQTLVPIMYLTLILIMGLALRSISGTLATLFIIAASMATAMGLAGWLGIQLSPSSVNAPTIILTLAVADSIHILVSMFNLMGRGKSKHEAIVESMRINLQPVLITSLTTAVGFLSMNYSDAPPFRDLGNIVAIGVAAAFIYSVLFLPAVMSLLPVRIGASFSEQCHSCNWLADLATKHYRKVFWLSILVIAGISAGAARIQLNDDFIKYFDDRYDFRRATDFAEQNLTGFHVIEYTLNAGGSGNINDPEFLHRVEAFANWYRVQPHVVHVFTLTDTIKRLNKNLHYDDEAYYRIPEDRELAAQYLLLYEMSLPFGLDLNNQINVDKSAIRMVVRLRDMTTAGLRAMDEKAQAWLQQNAPASMYDLGTGMSIMFSHISSRNIESMLGASFGALVIISVMLIIALKSFKIGLLSLAPNLTPALMAFGLWGFLVGQVGLVVSILAALTLGIVVDDTIHFLSKYLRARREHGASPEVAIRYAFNTVGTAMWMTTLILVAGFSILTFSGFELNADMGLMTSITIIIALVLDFIFLPALILMFDKDSGPPPASEVDSNSA